MKYKISTTIDKDKVDALKALGFEFECEEISEFIYPMWFKSINNEQIVKFTGLKSGEVIKKGPYTDSDDVGYTHNCYLDHTDTDTWEQIDEPKSMVEFKSKKLQL